VNGSRVYDEAAAASRQPGPVGARDDGELIRLAALAASSHNTQPWRFRVAADVITILPDRSRRCPVVDPDDAHLYKSLGCAAENLVHAASMQGRAADVRYDAAADAVHVTLGEAGTMAPTELSRALTTRQCTKTSYDGSAVDPADLAVLQQAGNGAGVRVLLVSDAERIAAIAHLVEQGNLAQLSDRSFRRELLAWIRFNGRAAVRTRDGLAGRVNRQPPLPTAIGRLLARVLISASRQAAADTTRLRTSAGVAVFLTEGDTREAWLEAGRAYERFSLQADLLGIRTAFINQPIEVAELRSALVTHLGTADLPQLMVRFGRGPRMPYSLRRPVEEVLAT
jgi:hypothetical protein